MDKAAKQAYKDMGEILPAVNAFEDPYFDTWDVSRTKVFSAEQRKLNKELTLK